jgi:hypothetical protein
VLHRSPNSHPTVAGNLLFIVLSVLGTLRLPRCLFPTAPNQLNLSPVPTFPPLKSSSHTILHYHSRPPLQLLLYRACNHKLGLIFTPPLRRRIELHLLELSLARKPALLSSHFSSAPSLTTRYLDYGLLRRSSTMLTQPEP